jgi:hypothetical protein
MGVSDHLLRLSLLSFALTAPLPMRVQRQIKLIFQPIRHRSLLDSELLGAGLWLPMSPPSNLVCHMSNGRALI